ncbi:hypothetical protein DOY81_007414 [Sarcophaga bullata]|nr:hypothetical protein DOY81_007414 [Sarcophaga bullata]
MSPAIFENILVFTILLGLSQAVIIRNQEPLLTQQQQQQQQQQEQQTYSQNSLEEPRFASRTTSSKDSKSKTTAIYDPVYDLGNQVLDNFDHRYPDGSYEFRYELADGQARYERGYFIKVNKQKSLVVVGYYSYRMPDGKYVTVFYNADRHGYRQNQSITRDTLPDLPRSIEVPQFKDDQSEYIETSTAQKLHNNHVSSTTKRSRF